MEGEEWPGEIEALEALGAERQKAVRLGALVAYETGGGAGGGGGPAAGRGESLQGRGNARLNDRRRTYRP